MSDFISIGSLLLLGVIAFQDFRDREISIWPLLGLFALFLTGSLYTKGFDFLRSSFLPNLLFLSIQYLGILTYFFIKNRARVKIIDTYFGLGDVFILLITAAAFSLFNYILFFYSVVLLSIITTMFMVLFKMKRSNESPFAGVLSLVMGGTILYHYPNAGLKFLDDSLSIELILNV